MKERKLPKGWKLVKLGEILKYEQPYKYIVKDTNYTETGIPVLTAGKSFILGYTQENEGVYKNVPVIIFDDFTTDNRFVDFPFKVKSSAIKFLRPRKENINLRFVYEAIQSLKYDHISGDHKRRWISEFQYLKILLPPFPEQEKIAEILETVDKAIEKTEKIIKKYKRIKQGLMQELFTKGIDENGKIRDEKTHRFKDSPLGRIPEEWEVVRLGDVVEVKRGASPRPKGDPRYFSNQHTGIHWLKISDISKYKRGIYLINTDEFLTKEGKQKSVYLKPYTLVLSNSGTVGKPIITKIPVCIHDGFLAIINLKNVINEFLYYWFEHKQENINSYAQQGTQNNLNTNIVESLYIILPPLPEQKRIAQTLLQIDKVIEREQKYKQKLESLKRGLMEDLLIGKVRVDKLIKKSD